MPVRLCRHCSRVVTDGRYAHDECRKAYQREKSRRRRAAKGTTSQRGYDAVHQKLSMLAISRHPYCTDCNSIDDLCADHVIPVSQGGRNVLSNYEVRCRSCNSSRATKKSEQT
jgi:5-methylcytosine-specific restriction endonuclease McrA